MKIEGKNFDQYLRLRKGLEEYRSDKAKAGRIGGALGKPPLKQNKLNGQALGLSNIKKETEMTVLCIQDFRFMKAGNRYKIIVAPKATMISPVSHQFKNWVEFVTYFKRYKEK